MRKLWWEEMQAKQAQRDARWRADQGEPEPAPPAGLRVTWDGKDLAAIQMLLGYWRVGGEPPYRVPGGDFSQLQVWEGTFGGDGGWVTMEPGMAVACTSSGDVSLMWGTGD